MKVNLRCQYTLRFARNPPPGGALQGWGKAEAGRCCGVGTRSRGIAGRVFDLRWGFSSVSVDSAITPIGRDQALVLSKADGSVPHTQLAHLTFENAKVRLMPREGTMEGFGCRVGP